jgi:hypothetical protein
VSVIEDRRCPNCQALVSADAEWCGQCFTSLRTEPEPATGPGPAQARGPDPGVSGIQVSADPSAPDAPTARWTCPACEHENALDSDVCEICGTSFGALFREGERRPSVEPRDALIRSLIFPGLGHRLAGYGPDGIARGALFLYTFGTTVLILVSGVSNSLVWMLLLYGSLSLAIYALTAMEAYRLAQGGGPIVSSRVLLWGIVSLILVSVLMAAFIIFAAAKS